MEVNVSTENHKPYFFWGMRLIPGFKRVFPEYSGITHHMLFQKPVLKHLFDQVENLHKCDFWIAFLKEISRDQYYGSGASEYEIYFNFLFLNSRQVRVRKLNWANGYYEDLPKAKKEGLSYLSCHEYLRAASSKK